MMKRLSYPVVSDQFLYWWLPASAVTLNSCRLMVMAEGHGVETAVIKVASHGFPIGVQCFEIGPLPCPFLVFCCVPGRIRCFDSRHNQVRAVRVVFGDTVDM